MKRSAPMRRTALARGGGVRARRTTPRRGRTVDADRLAFIRDRQPCRVRLTFGAAAGPCIGAIEVEHQREGVGMGQRASDAATYAICRGHHIARHDGRGPFKTLSRDGVRAFVSASIAATDADYAAHLTGRLDAIHGEVGA